MRHILLLLLTLLLVIPVGASQYAKVVNVSSSLNMRERATTNSSVAGKLAPGDTVEVLSAEGQWTYICYGSTLGYVKSSYLQTIEKTQDNVITQSSKTFTPSSYRWKLWVIMILLIITMQLFASEQYHWGLLLTCVICAVEVWYLNSSYPEWFVRPYTVGWGWTIFNGFLLLIFLMMQYVITHLTLGYFGVSGILSDWGFRITLVMSLLDPGFGVLGALVAILVIFIANLISEFSWRNFLYVFIGCIIWFAMFKLFGKIIKEFHEFFVWTIVLFIFGSIPASNVSYGPETVKLDDGTIVKHSHGNIWEDVTDSNRTYERDSNGDFRRVPSF